MQCSVCIVCPNTAVESFVYLFQFFSWISLCMLLIGKCLIALAVEHFDRALLGKFVLFWF